MTPEKDSVSWGCSDGQNQIENMLITDNQLSFYQHNYDSQFTIAKDIG